MDSEAGVPKRHRLIRRLVLLATVLAAGLLFTVASSSWLAVNSSIDYLGVLRQRSFAVQAPKAVGCTELRGWGSTKWSTFPDPAHSTGVVASVPSWVMLPRNGGDIFETEAFGWPARALYRHRDMARLPGIGFAPRWSDTYDVGVNTSHERHFPLGRVWIGLAIDAVFWGVVFGPLWFGVVWLKAALSRRRGLCPACGYDRRGLGPGAVCPECGVAPDRANAVA